MKLALLDCHFANERRPDNPCHMDEVYLGRRMNRDILASLSTRDNLPLDVLSVAVDAYKPRTVSEAMKIKVNESSSCDVALEAHFNYHPNRKVPGWIVEVGRGNAVSELLGSRLASRLAVVAEVPVPIVQIPDDRYTTSYLFEHMAIPFVLVELGNLHRPELIRSYLERGKHWFRVVESVVQSLVDFVEIMEGKSDEG